MINVTCGIIHFENEFLISQRSRNKREYSLFWELPGGKCNENECIELCLKRELKEELNIDIEFLNVEYIKTNFMNKYDLYYCSCKCLTNLNKIKFNSEIERFAIVSKEDLLDYNFIKGDKEILTNYLSKI